MVAPERAELPDLTNQSARNAAGRGSPVRWSSTQISNRVTCPLWLGDCRRRDAGALEEGVECDGVYGERAATFRVFVVGRTAEGAMSFTSCVGVVGESALPPCDVVPRQRSLVPVAARRWVCLQCPRRVSRGDPLASGTRGWPRGNWRLEYTRLDDSFQPVRANLNCHRGGSLPPWPESKRSVSQAARPLRVAGMDVGRGQLAAEPLSGRPEVGAGVALR